MVEKVKDMSIGLGPSGVTIYASTDTDTIGIVPASTPSAIRFYEAYQRGEPLTRGDALEVSDAVFSEFHLALPWIVTRAEIVQADDPERALGGRPWNLLVVTFQAKPLEFQDTVWLPKTPSGRAFLKSFQSGKKLTLENYLLSKRLMKFECEKAGLCMNVQGGVLDWNPAWEDYL